MPKTFSLVSLLSRYESYAVRVVFVLFSLAQMLFFSSKYCKNVLLVGFCFASAVDEMLSVLSVAFIEQKTKSAMD